MISTLPKIIATTVETAGKTNIGMVSDVFRQGSTEKKRKARTIPTAIIIHLDSLCRLVYAMMLRATSNKFC
jgi:hypothetical protein